MNLKKIPDEIPVFGDVDYRAKSCPLEVVEQIGFLSLLKIEFPDLAEIAVHIRNEGKRSKREGANQKIEGLKTGASDILIPCSPPIVMEIKRRDHTKSSISGEQIKYLINSHNQGAFSCVTLGAIGSIEAVRAWHTIHHQL